MSETLSMTAAEYRKYTETGKLPGRFRKAETPVDLDALLASAKASVPDARTAPDAPKGKKAPARPRHTPGEMNKTEAAFATDFLDVELREGRIWEWRFEPFKLRLAKNTTYSPDFITVGQDGITVYEVKGGFMEEDSNVKWKIAAEAFWWMRFRMAFVKLKKGRIESIEWMEYTA